MEQAEGLGDLVVHVDQHGGVEGGRRQARIVRLAAHHRDVGERALGDPPLQPRQVARRHVLGIDVPLRSDALGHPHRVVAAARADIGDALAGRDAHEPHHLPDLVDRIALRLGGPERRDDLGHRPVGLRKAAAGVPAGASGSAARTGRSRTNPVRARASVAVRTRDTRIRGRSERDAAMPVNPPPPDRCHVDPARLRAPVSSMTASPWNATVLTLYPEMFRGRSGSPCRAMRWPGAPGALRTRDIREHGLGRHRAVDDTPAGGGAGMVLRCDVLAAAIDAAAGPDDARPRLLMSPRGRPLTQARRPVPQRGGPACSSSAAASRASTRGVIAGRGLEEVSIGDNILSGGEIAAALVVLDACVRLLPGVMGKLASGVEESFETGHLEYPHYTRPGTGRAARSRRAHRRQPRRHRAMAPGRGPAPHPRAPARPAARPRGLTRRVRRASGRVAPPPHRA